jgi:DNA polymerase-1
MALPGIKDIDNELKTRARAGEPYRTLGGRTYYAEPSKVIDGEVRSFDYKCLNTVIQGSSADMTKQAVINYWRSQQRSGRLLAIIHDEILVSVDPEKALDESRILVEAMEHALHTDVPMIAEPKYGPNFAEMHE